METFYNTTELKGKLFNKAFNKAKYQDDIIMEMFLLNPDKLFTPLEVHRTLFGSETPITSVRRSITNLEKDGKLEKTSTQKQETFGRPNFTWKLYSPIKSEPPMNIEQQLRMYFETFVFCEANTKNEDLERCKAGNKYFFDNQTSLYKMSEMIVKMQKVMFKILPASSSEHFNKQFTRMNELVKLCKQHVADGEKEKSSIA